MSSRGSRRRGRSGGGKTKRGKSAMDGVDVDDDMRDFIFDIEHSAKKILKSYNKRVLLDVARAKVDARKAPAKHREAWPETGTGTMGGQSYGMTGTMGGGTMGSTMGRTYPPASSPGFNGPGTPGYGMTGTMGSTMDFAQPDASRMFRTPSGGGGGFGTTFIDRPNAASRLLGMSTNGKPRKTAPTATPFHLEETAVDLARTSLPPLAPTGVQAAAQQAMGGGAGAGLSLSQSMSLVQQAAGYGESRTGFTGGAGMPSSMQHGHTAGAASTMSATGGAASTLGGTGMSGASAAMRRTGSAPALSLTRTRMSARTRRKLAKLRQSPLAVSRADPAARSLTPSPMQTQASMKQTIGKSLKMLAGVTGHQHTHGPDHAIERRMCKACWSQPQKMTANEGGLRTLALGLTKQLETQGPTNWSSDDLRTKYRDEQTRDEAWEACQEALRDAEILEREQGVVVPVVIVDKHPVHRGVHQQVDLENSMSQRRARARNAMKVFSFDVRAVWLSGEVPGEAPMTGRSHGSASTMSASVASHRGGSGGHSRGLSGRRDATAIAAGHHQVQSVAFIRAMADAVATDMDPDMERAAAEGAATRRLSVASDVTTSTAVASVAEPEPLGLFPGQVRMQLPWFRKGVKLVHGVRRPPDQNGVVTKESTRGLKSFVTVSLELTVRGVDATVAPPLPSAPEAEVLRQETLAREHQGRVAARLEHQDRVAARLAVAGDTSVPEFALRGAKLAAPARVTGVVIRACALGTFDTHTVRLTVAEFKEQLDAQCRRELEKVSQVYAAAAAELQEMEAQRARELAEQEARYGKRRQAGEEVPPRLLHLRRVTAVSHNRMAELQQYAAKNPLTAGSFPVAFTVGVTDAAQARAERAERGDGSGSGEEDEGIEPGVGRAHPAQVYNEDLELTPDNGTYRPLPPPDPVMNQLVRLLRFVVVAVPAPMPLRGSRARLAVAAQRGDWTSAFDAQRPSDPHHFIGSRRDVHTFANEQQRAGSEVRTFGWNTRADGDMQHHLWLNQQQDWRYEAFNMMAGRETQQLVPDRFPSPYEQAVLAKVNKVKDAMEGRRDHVRSDVWGASAPVGSAAGYAPVLHHPALAPHLNDPVPLLPLSALVSGFMDVLHQVPGLTVVGTYVTSAAVFVRDAAISSTDGITVTLSNGLETPFLAPRVQALNEEAIYPKRRKELLCVDATPSTVSPSALGVLVSVLDERLPHTVVTVAGAADPDVDSTSVVKGHRRAGPVRDGDTRFRWYDVKKLLVPAPGLETRPFGVTMGAATLNAQDVWPQRYTWHSEVAVRHGRENQARDFYYVLVKKFTQGPNDPNRFTARLLHERVRRLDSSSLSEFLRVEEERRAAAEEAARKEELARKIEAGRKAKARREAEKTNLAFQWRQKNIRRAARLRGKTAALGLSHAEWTAKRRKPGARCVARFAGWERWVILVPREAVKQAELVNGDAGEGSVSRRASTAGGGGDVYSEVWYHQPQSGDSQWDPPPVWPEDEWDAEEEVDADVMYDSDGNSIAGDYQHELDRTVLRSRASRRSMKSRGSSRYLTDQSLTAARERFMLTILERALRRWAVEVAIEGLPTRLERDGRISRPSSRGTAVVVDTARTGSTAARRRSTKVSSLGVAEHKGREGSGLYRLGDDGTGPEADLDYETEDDAELGVQGRGSGLDSRGDGLFDLRTAFEFLDCDSDGIVNVRDWAKVSSGKSGLSLEGQQLPPGQRPVVGETADNSNGPTLMVMLWPFVTEALQRTTPSGLRKDVHDIVPTVAAAEHAMHVEAAPAPVSRPQSASQIFAQDHPLASQQDKAAASRGGETSEVPSRAGTRKSILKSASASRRVSALTSGSHEADVDVAGVVGFAVNPHDVHHQIEQLMTPNVRLHFFRRMQELSPGEGFTYNDWVAFVARVRQDDDWFGVDPDLWRMRPDSWEAYETRLGVARAVGSWTRHQDPTSGDYFYKSSLTGQTVWEKCREHLLAEKKMRRLLVTRVDAEVFAEQSQQRRRWRASMKAKLLAEEQARRIKAEKLAGTFKRGEAGSGAASAKGGAASASRPVTGAAGDGAEDRAADGREPGVDSLVETLSSNPKLIAALARQLGLGPPTAASGNAGAGAPAGQMSLDPSRASSPTRGWDQRRGASRSSMPPVTAAQAAAIPIVPSSVPKLNFQLAGLPEGHTKTRAVNHAGRHSSVVSFGEAKAREQQDADAMRDESAAVDRRGAVVPAKGTFPGIGWRQLRAPKKGKNLKARAKETQVLGPHVTKLNSANAASIVALVDPSEAVPYSMKYAGPGLQPLLVMDVTADMEERHRKEEAEREARAISSRPTTAGGPPGTAASGITASGLNARNAGLSGPESSAAVLSALGDPERKLSEEELKAQLRFKAFLAVKNNKYDNLEMLLDEGVPVNSKDENGNTMLIVAAQNGLKRVSKLLLRRGANMDETNLRGNTALHYAFAYKFQELGDYLLAKGADDGIVNAEGLTCYEGLDQDAVDAI